MTRARKNNPSASRNSVSRDPVRDHAKLWVLKILLKFHAYKKIRRSIHEDSVFDSLGVGLEEGRERRSDQAVKADLWELLNRYEKRIKILMPVHGFVADNIRSISKVLGMNEMEQGILAFMAIMHSDQMLMDTMEGLGEISRQDSLRLFSIVLNLPRGRVTRALENDRVLLRSGLLNFDLEGRFTLRGLLEMGKGMRQALLRKHPKNSSPLDDFFWKSPAPRTRPEDFDHMRDDYQFLRGYLAEVMSRRKRVGVNILVHGRPGTGKTEMVRTLCQELGIALHDVAIMHASGYIMDRGDRLSAYRLAQIMLMSGRQNAILFDEIEDVFPATSGLFGMTAKDTRNKAWINRALEENPVPAFWVSNNIHDMDTAYLRRFDYILEFKIPNRVARERMVRQYTKSFDISRATVELLASNESIVPAYIERAAKVAKCLEGREGITAEHAMVKVIGNVLEAVGGEPCQPNGSKALCYDPALVNTGSDPESLVAGIAAQGRARLCLYGPPGTGKTAFAQYIADRSGKPLLVKRASDLLSRYVGGSERNIASAFRQTRDEGAVLVMDEADSLLQDRQTVQQAWEASQVNEMLVQIENFEGIFIASTNLMDRLDAAALRRFDFKIKFGYLLPEQRYVLFTRVLCEAGYSDKADLASWQGRLRNLDVLTPGDFAVAVRQLRVLNWQPDPKRLFDALESECRAKPGAARGPMGFAFN